LTIHDGLGFQRGAVQPGAGKFDTGGTANDHLRNGNSASYAYPVTLPGSAAAVQTTQVNAASVFAPGTSCE
jgi:hypothetical protein